MNIDPSLTVEECVDALKKLNEYFHHWQVWTYLSNGTGEVVADLRYKLWDLNPKVFPKLPERDVK